jgi:hypothetical protein
MNMNDDLRLGEFKESLRSMILEKFDIDISVPDIGEFMSFDFAVFVNNFGHILNREEIECAEEFFIFSRSIYLYSESSVEIKSFIESRTVKKFSEIYRKLHSLI